MPGCCRIGGRSNSSRRSSIAGIPSVCPPEQGPHAKEQQRSCHGVSSALGHRNERRSTPQILVPGRGASPFLTAGISRGSAFQISEERLKEFLQAEVAFFAGRESSSLTLKQVIESSSPEQAGRLVVQELPTRFAQRILQIESLPHWESFPELCHVHGLYTRSFRDLRLVELDVRNPDAFTDIIQSLKGRMKTVIPNLATSFQKLQAEGAFEEQQIGTWLDTFLLSRIGTEMLTSQYLATTQTNAKLRGSRSGIVDHACEPVAICERAAKHVRQLCKQHYNMEQDLEIIIEPRMDGRKNRVRFPYVPQYLFYILVELLKNSARATVEVAGRDQSQIRARPIVVTVGADPSQVAIRVHDSAGGIPFSVADRVWSYMYSTARETKGGNFTQQGTPLAGFGVGLPLSRLYARYLGGSLHLLSLPGIGTRAYLYLKRVQTEAREELPDIGTSVNEVDPWL